MMGYATKKKAPKIFMDNILRNGNLLWMKINVGEQVKLFLITNCDDRWSDPNLHTWVNDNVFGGRGRKRQTFGFFKIIFCSCWNHLNFLIDISLVVFLSYIHSGDFKADLPTIVLLVLVTMIAFPLFVNYSESFEEINRTKILLPSANIGKLL